MIRYDLTCETGHAFDAWFRDSDAYDEQAASGLLSCPHCGSARVTKGIMAPRVAKAPEAELAEARAARRENACRYVGTEFAEKALAMHRGELPDERIRGEASPRQTRELIEAGVPIAPWLGDGTH